MKELLNASYEEMEKFILDNMEYTYNVKKVLSDEVNDLEANCMFVFEMHDNKFQITNHVEVKNEDTENEEIIATYDVEKIK